MEWVLARGEQVLSGWRDTLIRAILHLQKSIAKRRSHRTSIDAHSECLLRNGPVEGEKHSLHSGRVEWMAWSEITSRILAREKYLETALTSSFSCQCLTSCSLQKHDLQYWRDSTHSIMWCGLAGRRVRAAQNSQRRRRFDVEKWSSDTVSCVFKGCAQQSKMKSKKKCANTVPRAENGGFLICCMIFLHTFNIQYQLSEWHIPDSSTSAILLGNIAPIHSRVGRLSVRRNEFHWKREAHTANQISNHYSLD